MKLAAIRAASVVAFLVALHALGCRDATLILSGTWRPGLYHLLGALYAITWLWTLIVEPILLLGAVLRTVMEYAGRDACTLPSLARRFVTWRSRGGSPLSRS